MPDVREVSVALTGEQIAAMSDAVKAGEYATTDDVVREAMELWKSHRTVLRPDANHLGRAWDAGKSSGPPTSLDFIQLREEARRRLADARNADFNAG